MATTMQQVKDRFENRSGGIIGASIKTPTGFKAVAVYPGETIDLDEEEQAVTANAPRDPRANPLANGSFVAISEGLDFKGRRPLRPDGTVPTITREAPSVIEPEEGGLNEETATVVETPDQPPVGAFGGLEETGTTTAAEISSREAARKPPPAPTRPGRVKKDDAS